MTVSNLARSRYLVHVGRQVLSVGRGARWVASGINTLAYRSCLLMISRLPRSQAFQAARLLGTLRYRQKRPRIAVHKGLASALHATDDQIEEWLRRSFQLATCEDLEAHLYPRMTKEAITGLIELRGVHHLVAALEKGRGAILYSGHFRGHFTFFAALGLFGYKPNVLGHPPIYGPSPAERWFHQRRNAIMEAELDCRFLLLEPDDFGVAVRAANALKRNEVIIIEIDKTASKETIEVPFLNGRAHFPSGPALLAQITGAPLLSFFVHRPDQWVPQIAEIGAPMYATGDLIATVRQCASSLERKILAHPPDWYHVWIPMWRLWSYLESEV